MLRPKFGEVYCAINDVKVGGSITYKRPASGGFDCIIPKSTRIVITNDPPVGALGVWVLPLNYAELEKKIIPSEEYNLTYYNGYGISVTFGDLKRSFIKENVSIKDIKFDNEKSQKKWELSVKIYYFQKTHSSDEELPLEIQQEIRELNK